MRADSRTAFGPTKNHIGVTELFQRTIQIGYRGDNQIYATGAQV
ncbi:MAG: hypothetical protein GPOALKHO_001921 [Sodalis sp.]|nr:MAG: hypothetical protein GPOALKHO_001921 [Sodalis sp.]